MMKSSPAFRLPCAIFATALACVSAMAATQTPTSAATTASAPVAHPQVKLHTSMGDIVIELFPDKAPKTVANFLQYVKNGFYEGTVFHRAIPGFLVQGGLYTRQLTPKRTQPPIPDEANNGLSNLRGTVSAARGPDPDSATAQFFFNIVDNPRLDYVGNQSGWTWGFAVFGKVVSGMDVVDKIRGVPTGNRGMHQNVPSQPVTILSATQIK